MGGKKRIAVKLHHKSNHSEAANNTGSKGPDDEREGSGDPFWAWNITAEVLKHSPLPAPRWEKVKTLCFPFLSSQSLVGMGESTLMICIWEESKTSQNPSTKEPDGYSDYRIVGVMFRASYLRWSKRRTIQLTMSTQPRFGNIKLH